jgi:outer membrane autotransporter protein
MPPTASFTVTVADREAPVLVGMPANIARPTDAGLAAAVVNWTAPTVTDNQPGATVRQTAGPVPGSAFPLGVTTITYVATDVAGNTSTASFTVTVIDGEAPTIAGLSANLAFDIDFPATSRVVTWVEPTARDNVAGATITRIAGPVSGAAFPVGTTTITYEARDVAGNSTRSSFTVTVRAIPPGSVTFIFDSQDGGRFAVAASEPALNASVTGTSGRSQIPPILVRPGTYPVTFTVPDGVGVTGASCTAGGSVLSADTKSGQIVLVSGQAVTCTITTVAAQRVATETIADLLETRQALILANQPSSDRRIGRLLNQPGGQTGGINLAGLQFQTQAPFNLTLGRDGRLGFTYSSLQAARINARSDEPGTAGTRLPGLGNNGVDVWAEGTIARFDARGGNGDFAIVHLGADYLANPNLLLGATVQFDWTDLKGAGAATSEGSGFMAGPYVTLRLADKLFFDGKVLAGTASNTVSPFGTYSDGFDSNRSLISAALIGSLEHGNLTIRPEARLTWFTEESDNYRDILGVNLPSVRAATGTLDLGPEFRWAIRDVETGDLEMTFAFTAVLAFEQTLESDAGISLERILIPDFRGRIKAGALYTWANGAVLNGDLFFDGIRAGDYRSWGGTLGIRLGF